jgi:ParB-like chromosome segregation protein Spo0J
MELILARLRLEQIVTAGPLPEAPDRLRESMAEFGQLDPVHARPLDDDRYTLTVGEEILSSAYETGLKELDAIVEPAECAALPSAARSLILDAQRTNLKLLYRARKARDLVENEGYTQVRVAKLLQVKESMLSRMLKVMRCPDLEPLVDREGLPFTAAMELAALEESPRRAYLAELREVKIACEHFPTVKQIRRGVHERQGKPGLPDLAPEMLLPFLADLLAPDRPLVLEIETGRRHTTGIRILIPESERDVTIARIERLRPPGAARALTEAGDAGLETAEKTGITPIVPGNRSR